MSRIEDIMTRDVTVVQCGDTQQTAAQRMRDLNVGSLPVCDGDILVGMVTDRDLAIRGVAAGSDPARARVSDAMSEEVCCCGPDDTIDNIMDLMGDAQIRRIPVIDSKRRVVGIVALGDLATRQSAPTDEALREISERTAPA